LLALVKLLGIVLEDSVKLKMMVKFVFMLLMVMEVVNLLKLVELWLLHLICCSLHLLVIRSSTICRGSFR
jgi:hypothetical protein